jgi:hypothetical protein
MTRSGLSSPSKKLVLRQISSRFLMTGLLKVTYVASTLFSNDRERKFRSITIGSKPYSFEKSILLQSEIRLCI